MSDITKSSVPIQLESVQTGNPVSESALIAMGGAINYILGSAAKVGDVMPSDLDEATFQSQRDTTWWLCDGRSAVGTVYQSLTGRSTIPDRRGTFLRMKDHGRGLNPNGDLPIGTYTADQLASHNHSFALTQRPANAGANAPALGTDTAGGVNGSETTSNTGGSETAPKSTEVNYFVKVNV